MAEIVTEGQRAIPAAAIESGYQFIEPELGHALASVLAD
jgi:NAD dependent epimerase/dehydratase family enzyme